MEKINGKYEEKFNDSDCIMLDVLHDKLIADMKLEISERTSDQRIFVEGIFSAAFGTAVMESQESYFAILRIVKI